MTFTTVDVTSKRLGQLHDLFPRRELISVLLDPNLPEFDVELRDMEIAAKTIGRRVLFFKAASPSELNAAFEALSRQGLAHYSSAAVRFSPPSVNGWPCCPHDMQYPQATRIASLPWRAG